MDDDRALAALGRLEAGQELLAANLERLAANHERLTANQERLAVTLEGLVANQERLAANQEALAASQERLALRVDGKIEQLRTELTDFRVVVMERFERVENKLSLMADEVTVNMGSVNPVSRRQDNDREEVRSLTGLVMKMFTIVHRLESEVWELQEKAA